MKRLMARVAAWVARRKSAVQWVAEIAGVGMIAGGVWMLQPWAGLVILGLYVVLVANTSSAGGE